MIECKNKYSIMDFMINIVQYKFYKKFIITIYNQMKKTSKINTLIVYVYVRTIN